MNLDVGKSGNMLHYVNKDYYLLFFLNKILHSVKEFNC